ncbi:MAG: TetR/AcrR family transcriptional regulator, partial [Acidimicrobiales bacterium]
AASLEPWPAMVAWLEAFVRYARGKRVLLEELHEAFDKNPQLRVASRERIVDTVTFVLRRAQDAGVVRTDVDGSDVMQLVGSMCTSATLAQGQDERLLRMILDGLRQPA